MAALTYDVSDTADDTTRQAIVRPLIEYNSAHTGIRDSRHLTVAVRDASGDVTGGLWGRTSYGWLFIELLAVPAPLRGQGIGSELMRRAEAEAVNRGCHDAWLDTFEFQARGFYERLGYRCFAELPDYPTGFARFFMTKRLGK